MCAELHRTHAAGPALERNVVAQLTNNGAPLANKTVATYRAPGPLKPGKAQQLKVKAGKQAFTYHYTPPADAARVLVDIVGSDGRHLQRVVSAKARHGAVAALGAPDTVTIAITGIAANGSDGPTVSAKAKLAAPKTKTKTKGTKKHKH